jgi:hypothetical protein
MLSQMFRLRIQVPGPVRKLDHTERIRITLESDVNEYRAT